MKESLGEEEEIIYLLIVDNSCCQKQVDVELIHDKSRLCHEKPNIYIFGYNFLGPWE